MKESLNDWQRHKHCRLIDQSVIKVDAAHYMLSLSWVGADIANKNQMPGASHIGPHPRTLRKAREQIKAMVNSGVSPRGTQKLLASMDSVVDKNVATLAVS